MPVDASHPNQLTLEIKDLALDGTGLAQHDGKLVFVEGALPAEAATVRITGQGRGKLHAEFSEVVKQIQTKHTKMKRKRKSL